MTFRSALIFCSLWLIYCKANGGHACRTNFTKLLQQISGSDQNRQQLEQVFLHLDHSPPSLVTVFYHYFEVNSTELSNGTEAWLWASSSFYFYHPPQVFQFSSLFFSDDTNPRRPSLHLNLSYDCYSVPENSMRMLTERVRV